MLHAAVYVPGDEVPLPESVVDDPDLRHYVEGFGGHRGDLGVVAERGIRPVGACWCRLFPEGRPGYGWVGGDVPELAIAVVEEERSAGLGTVLLDDLIERAAAAGFERVSLSVDARSPAVRLYERSGFVAVDRDGTSITMVRSTRPRRRPVRPPAVRHRDPGLDPPATQP